MCVMRCVLIGTHSVDVNEEVSVKLKCIAITKHWLERPICFKKRQNQHIFRCRCSFTRTKPLCYGNSIISFHFYFIIVIIWDFQLARSFELILIFVRFSQGVDNEDWVCPLIWILLIAIPHAYRLALHIHDCRLYSTFDT